MNCYKIASVEAYKEYRIKFSISGDFHIRFCITAPESEDHLEFLTKNIYGSIGTYEYILRTTKTGDLCLCRSTGRTNEWTTLSDIVVEVL